MKLWKKPLLLLQNMSYSCQKKIQKKLKIFSSTGCNSRPRPWMSKFCFLLYKSISKENSSLIWKYSKVSVTSLLKITIKMDPWKRVCLPKRPLTSFRCSKIILMLYGESILLTVLVRTCLVCNIQSNLSLTLSRKS